MLCVVVVVVVVCVWVVVVVGWGLFGGFFLGGAIFFKVTSV